MKAIHFRTIRATVGLLLLLSFLPPVSGQQVETYQFAERDTCVLRLDVYQPTAEVRKDICVIYVFGGGFVGGSRKDTVNVRFFREMVTRGYTVVAIDYRLGLKHVKLSLFHLKPGFQAPVLASEDLISATEFILANKERLHINPQRIVLIGSSAGAITVLHTDYELANRTEMVSKLPSDFRYAGVVSLAGAILSTKGSPRYAREPAPTLFYHGTKDKIVIYNKFSFFRKGMYGTKFLVKRFEKHHYPFMAVRYQGMKHQVASFPRFEAQDQLCDFIDRAADGRYTNELDITIRNKELQQKYK